MGRLQSSVLATQKPSVAFLPFTSGCAPGWVNDDSTVKCDSGDVSSQETGRSQKGEKQLEGNGCG